MSAKRTYHNRGALGHDFAHMEVFRADDNKDLITFTIGNKKNKLLGYLDLNQEQVKDLIRNLSAMVGQGRLTGAQVNPPIEGDILS